MTKLYITGFDSFEMPLREAGRKVIFGHIYENLENMKLYIKNKLLIKCYLLKKVIFSDSPSVVFD